METNFKVDVPSFALGYSAGKKKIPPAQEKEITVTKNGTTEVTPDEGQLLSKVTVNAKIAGKDVLDSLMDKSITEMDSDFEFVRAGLFLDCNALTRVSFPNAKRIEVDAFHSCSFLESADFPEVISIDARAFMENTNLASINLPKATTMSTQSFEYNRAMTRIELPEMTAISYQGLGTCMVLEIAILPKVTKIENYAFKSCYSLKAVVLRSESVCTLANKEAFNGCYHILGTKNTEYNPNKLKDGYFYVPSALVESYKVATNWSTYATQFRALEDYTVDGTITGELDPNKI